MTQIKRLTDVVAQTSAEKAHLDRRAALAATPAQALAVPAWPAPAGVPERIALAGGRPLHQVRPTACDECSLPAPYGLPAGNGCGHFHYSCLQRRLASDGGDSDRTNRVAAPAGSLRVMDLVERLPEDEDPHRCTVCGADVSGEIPARREPVTVSGWYGPHLYQWRSDQRGSRVDLDDVRCPEHRSEEYLEAQRQAGRVSYEAFQERERVALQARYDQADAEALAEAKRMATRTPGRSRVLS